MSKTRTAATHYGASRLPRRHSCSNAVSMDVTFEPNSKITVQFCPLKDGRPGSGIGWVKLANGSFISPTDGGCNGIDEAIERWKGWLAKGYTSSAEAQNTK